MWYYTVNSLEKVHQMNRYMNFKKTNKVEWPERRKNGVNTETCWQLLDLDWKSIRVNTWCSHKRNHVPANRISIQQTTDPQPTPHLRTDRAPLATPAPSLPRSEAPFSLSSDCFALSSSSCISESWSWKSLISVWCCSRSIFTWNSLAEKGNPWEILLVSAYFIQTAFRPSKWSSRVI